MTPAQIVPIDDSNTWLCRHENSSGSEVPATTLSLSDGVDRLNGHPTAAPRLWLRCGTCGTRWRAWPERKVAKPSVGWLQPAATPPAPRIYHSPVIDIDRLIDVVCTTLPNVQVEQSEGTWPEDDDGLWSFGPARPTGSLLLPGAVNVESGTGMCPLSIELDDLRCVIASTVDAAAEALLPVLAPKARG